MQLVELDEINKYGSGFEEKKIKLKINETNSKKDSQKKGIHFSALFNNIL